MKRTGTLRWGGWLLVLTLTACQRSPAPDPPAAEIARSESTPDLPAMTSPVPQAAELPGNISTAVLALTGFGPLRIGAPPAGGFRDEDVLDGDCRIFSDPAHPGISAMVIDGIVERITLSRGRAGEPIALTSRGIGYGATEAAVRDAYAPLDEKPHEYLHPQGKNLYTGDGADGPAFRFEMGIGGTVSHVHVGRAPALAYAENCL